jgi:hypothetical protein
MLSSCARIEENRAQLESMRQKAELLAGEHPVTDPEGNWPTPEFTVRDADVEVAFLRERQNRSRS